MTSDEKKTQPDVKRSSADVPTTKISWADVVAASTETSTEELVPDTANAVEEGVTQAFEEPEPPAIEREPLRAGDIVRHPKFGDCIVHRIDGKPPFVHMARPNEKVRRLSLDIVAFDFLAIEGRCRVFTMHVKK